MKVKVKTAEKEPKEETWYLVRCPQFVAVLN